MRFLLILLAASLAACSPFVYYSPEASAELRSAMAAANEARIDGPARVQLAAGTTLFVQTGLVFIPAPQAERLLRATGRRPTRETQGMLIHATSARTDMVILYSDLSRLSWGVAPELAVFRPR